MAGYAIEKEIERFQEKRQIAQKFFYFMIIFHRTWIFLEVALYDNSKKSRIFAS